MTSRSDNKKTGNLGEDIAAQFLEDKGYKIVQRNYRYLNFGEIDIIAKQNEYLVFIEVKTYRTAEFGEPFLLVTHKKQEKLRKIAQVYLLYKKLNDIDCRFDVIGIKIGKDDKGNLINHIENAF